MKRFALLLPCLFLLLNVSAQKKSTDDSHYLVGAVPEEDGRVVFTRQFSIPDMPKDEIFKRTLGWLNTHMEANDNDSRVVYNEPAEGKLVAIGAETIVFSASMITLDKATIQYYVDISIDDQQCSMRVERIRYKYTYNGKTDRYTAEGWITDDVALNKKKDKLVIGFAKWRRRTVDFVDKLSKELVDALSAVPTEIAQEEEANPQPASPDETIVVKPRKRVVSEPAVTEVPPTAAPTPQEEAPAEVESAPAPKPIPKGYVAVNPNDLPSNAIQMGAGKLIITVGEGVELTADAGGSLGKMQGQAVVFSMLAYEQPYELMEQAETYTVSFYPTGKKRASVILRCHRLPSQAPLEGQPRMYVGAIDEALCSE